MRKIFIILIISILHIPGIAQLHYSGSWNIEAGVGINDMSCVSPVVGAGYTFNGILAVYGRYSMAHASRTGYDIRENNIELLVSYTPMHVREVFFVNLNIGPVFKFQRFGDFQPAIRANSLNIGGAADVDLELSLGIYWSLFGRASYRLLLADERKRHELFYSAGVRVSMNIFNAAERRVLRPSKISRK